MRMLNSLEGENGGIERPNQERSNDGIRSLEGPHLTATPEPARRQTMLGALGSFEKGTDSVPKTGVYKLHEGEAVIPKDKNMHDMKDKAIASLSDGEKKPKKEIKEMVHRKSANGKHIVVHRHHHPEHHPDEEHALEDISALHNHMEDHAGTPNEGEAAPEGASAPPQMTAAPSAAPPPPMAGMAGGQ